MGDSLKKRAFSCPFDAVKGYSNIVIHNMGHSFANRTAKRSVLPGILL